MLDRDHAWIAGFLGVYAYLLRDVTLGRLYAFGDLPPYYGVDAARRFLATWHYGGLGFSHQYNTFVGYQAGVTLVGGELGQNLFYLALIPAGFATFAVFARRFVDSGPALYIAAGVYAINPITIGEFVNGGANEFLSFVGMPLVLHYLWAVHETDSWWPTVKAGAVFGATTVIPWTSFWLLAPFAAHLAYRSRRTPAVLAKFVAAGVVGVVLTLPSVYYILQRARSLDATETMFAQVEWNYAAADPLSLLRLAGNHGSYAMSELGYNTDPALMVGLVIPAVGLVAWQRERLRFMFGIAAALVAFAVLTKLTVTYPLFEGFPLLWSVRNPAKLQYPLLLATSVLFGAGLEVLLASVRNVENEAVVRAALLGVVVLALFSYVAPASAGGLGLEETRGDGYYVPDAYYDVSERLDGKVLWAPYTYTTQLRLRRTYPNHVGIPSGGIAQDKENARYVADLFDDFARGDRVHGRLADLGVRYVVVERHGQQRYRAATGDPRAVVRYSAPWLYGDPTTYVTRLEASSDYERAFTTDRFAVFEVAGVDQRDRFERHQGVHRVVYPEERGSEVVSEENFVANGDFDDGLDDWWSWTGDTGTQTVVANTADGEHAALLRTTDGETYPIAQQVDVRDRYPYRLTVDAEGPGVVNLYWYDGSKSEDNLVAQESYPLSDLPATLLARGDSVSVRVRPNATRLLVREVTLRRSTYPTRTGFAENTEAIPGVVVDGHSNETDVGRVVAVNLNESRTAAVDPAVSITDAETVLEGELVLDESLRQGAGVRLPDDELPTVVPADAEVVTEETPDGTVVDYWVVGEFDDRPVTVLHTSYSEQWRGPSDATHFEAYGWANGFIDATPDEIRWTGVDGQRRMVILGWLGLWAVTLVGLALHWIELVIRRLQASRGRSDRLDRNRRRL